MTEYTGQCCRNCAWFRSSLPGLLAGWCANPLVARLEGQYGLQRAGSNSCTLWASKWHAEASDHTAWDPKQVFKVSGHTDLSDADLAEADRQARRIKEETK